MSVTTGKELVDYITQYLCSIRERRVIPDVKPGYMRELLPDAAPTEAEDWESIFNDIEKVIMPGVSTAIHHHISQLCARKQLFSHLFPQVVHWQSPHMHAYYPSLTSWASMLGDMLSDAINCIGFTWVRGQPTHCFSTVLPKIGKINNIFHAGFGQASSPACTELEMNMLDWLCKALGLPSFFLHYHPDSRGGGVLQVCNTVIWQNSTVVSVVIGNLLSFSSTRLFC